MIWFFLWIACGVIGGIIAGAKGRSGSAWGILCFLFGPLALIFIALLPANQAEIEHNKIQSGAYKKCPACAETIKREAIKCKHCGSDLSQTHTQPTAVVDIFSKK